MASSVIFVPKYDEWHAIRWAFALEDLVEPEYMATGASVYRASFADWNVTFCLMNEQNTTRAAVTTSLVLDREKPDYAFLAGTALGRSTSVSIGSVVLSTDGVHDLVERRIEQPAGSETARSSYSPYTISSPVALAMTARDFVTQHFERRRLLHRHIREACRELGWSTTRIRNFLAEHNPKVVSEAIASGNDYFMGAAAPSALLWDVHGKPKAYDMETAGFARASPMEAIFLTAEEVDLLAKHLAAVHEPYGLLVYFAAYTGLRAGEIGALRVKHLDLLRKQVTVCQSVSGVPGKPGLIYGPTKTGKARVVNLPTFLTDALAAYLTVHPKRHHPTPVDPDELVFRSVRGAPLHHTAFSERYFKPAVIASLPKHLHGLRFHDLRHVRFPADQSTDLCERPCRRQAPRP